MKYFFTCLPAGRRDSGFLTIPVAIVLAGIIIAFAVIYGMGRDALKPTSGTAQVVNTQTKTGIDDLRGLSSDDHVIGAKNGTIVMIEYSDTECPFCKRFQETMHQAVREYPNDVAWVYRHFPIPALHSRASKEAEATECATELGGNDAFWNYLDLIFETTPSNNGLDPAQLPALAEQIGLKRTDFEACLASGKYKEKVDAEAADAVAAGANGTPFTVVIAPNNQRFTINGAEPYESVKKVIEFALKLK